MATQTYQLIVTGICADQFVQNVLHFRMDDDGYTNRLAAAKGLIDGLIAADWHASFLACVPDAYVMQSLKARRVSNGGGPEWISTELQGSEGTLGSDTEISGAGPVAILYTDGGPRRIGKIFFPGIAPANVDGDQISQATLDTINSSLETMRVPFDAVGGTTPPVTLTIPRANNLALRSNIVESTVSRYVGKQRRRQVPV